MYSIGEDTEIIGYLIVSVEVSELLRDLIKFNALSSVVSFMAYNKIIVSCDAWLCL